MPAGTPPELVKKLNADLDGIVHSAALAARWKELGVTPIGGKLEAVNAFIATEKTKYTALIRERQLSADE